MKNITKAILSLIIISLNITNLYCQEEQEYSPYELLSSYYENDFKPFKKGNWYTGLAFSLDDRKASNTKGLFENIIDGNELNYNVTLKGGYFTGDYGMVGLGLEYYQDKFTGMVFRDPDTLQSNTITRGYNFTPFIRSSVPLTRNERLSFFTTIGLGFGIANTNSRDTKNLDEINKKYITQYNFGIGISPGITFFAMENFAFEVGLNLLGYNIRITDTTTNGIEESRDVRQNVNFSIDILTLDLGLAYYFNSKR